MTAVPPSPYPEASPPTASESGRGLALLGYGLLLATIFTAGISGFIAMVLAYDRKGRSGPILRSHFAFQLRIFWICFALTFAAGAMGISSMVSYLTALPPPIRIHASPDAQLISLSAPNAIPVDVEGWSYSWSGRPGPIPRKAALEMAAGLAMMTAAVLFSWLGPVFGMVRLASGRPIGQSRAAEQTP